MSEMIFQRMGNCFIPQRGVMTQYDTLPAGTYTVEVHNNAFHLVVADDLGAPGKVYGSARARAERVVKSFLAREGITTGIWLDGLKGTGKTHLVKLVSEILRTKHKIPTLLIDKPYAGSEFNRFICDIRQPCFVLIDEAEKTYRGEGDADEGRREYHSQAALLPLLDGAYSSHKLFAFVTNEPELHNSIIDRPGRILYRWKYERLEDSVIIEYANDELKNKEHVDELLALMRMVKVSSFDVLKGLIWEINQYNEKPFQAIANLNIGWDPKRQMFAQVMGIEGGRFAGHQWEKSVTLNGVTLKFDLQLDKQTDDPEEKARMDEVRHNYQQSNSVRSFGSRPQPELIAQYYETFLSIRMGPENLVNYLHEEDVYEFQDKDFFVRISKLSSDGQLTVGDITSTLYGKLASLPLVIRLSPPAGGEEEAGAGS